MDLFVQQPHTQVHQLVLPDMVSLAYMLRVHWVVSSGHWLKRSRCQVRSLQHFSFVTRLPGGQPVTPLPLSPIHQSLFYPAHNTLTLDIKIGWETVLKGLLSWGKNIHCSPLIHKFSHFITQGNPGGQVWLTPGNSYIYTDHSQPLLFYVPRNTLMEDSLCVTFYAQKQGWLPASIQFPTLLPGLAWRGANTCFPPVIRNFPALQQRWSRKMSQNLHEGISKFSLHLGWAPSGPVNLYGPSKVTPALILIHCSCLFSSFYLLPWTLEIRLVKRQWRLWALCLLSLNHPATAPHFPCPAHNSWETNKQGGMVWNSLRNMSHSALAGKESSQSSYWQQWKSPNLRTRRWQVPSQISYKPNKIWHQ